MPDSISVETNASLPAPGDRSLFKVYTINEDGNEKGSNVVDIVWS